MALRTNARAVAGLLMVAGISARVDAQRAPTSLRLQGGLTYEQTLTVTADQPAHFAVFAVGRSAVGNPILLLTDAAAVRQKRMRARRLTIAELSRFAPASEVAIIALASASAPSLDAFTAEGRSAIDLVIGDSAMADAKQLVSSLAATVFGKGVHYTARMLPMEAVSEVPSGPTRRTNSCGESVLSAAPSTGYEPPTRKGWFLNDGDIGREVVNPRYAGVSSNSIADDQAAGRFQSLDGAYYAVVRTQLAGCVVWEVVPVPAPMPRPTPVPINPTPTLMPITPPVPIPPANER